MAHAVEHTAQHIRGHAQLNAMAQETHLGLGQVDTGGAFEQLHQGVGAVHFQHLAPAHLSRRQLDFRQFVISDLVHALHQHQRAGHFLYGTVFLNHASLPPWEI